MAKLFTKSVGEITFECYSERGIMSFLMFRYLPYGNNLNLFLEELEFSQNLPNPFKGESVENPVFFSELDFGNKGFGKPDGAIFFILKNNPCMIFIESKFNESYEESCKNTNYNSTIKGQLELRWRGISLYKEQKEKAVVNIRGICYLIETPKYRKYYFKNDLFYKKLDLSYMQDIAGFRRLRLIEGVEKIFKQYIDKCKIQSIYYLVISNDNKNPFNNIRSELLPDCFNKSWKKMKNQYCWVKSLKIEKCKPI